MSKPGYIISLLVFFIISCLPDEERNQETHKKRLNDYFSASEKWEHSNIDSALYYSQKAYNLSVDQQDVTGQIKSLSNIGYLLQEKNEGTKAYQNYKKALTLAEQIKDSSLIARSLNYIGLYHSRFGNYDTALKNFLASHQIRIQLKDTLGQSVTAGNIGLNYHYVKNYKLAETYLKKAISIDSLYKDSIYLIDDYLNISLLYKEQHKDSLALLYNEKCIEFAEIFNDQEALAYATANIGLVYLHNKQFKKASEYFEKSARYRKTLQRPLANLWHHIHYMDLYREWGNHSKALLAADSAQYLNQSIGKIDLQERIHASRANSYENLNEYEKAIKEHKLVKELVDSQNSQKRLNMLASIEAELGVLEKENQLFKLKNNNLTVKKQLYLVLFAAIGLAFLTLSIYSFMRNKSLREQKQFLLEKHLLQEQHTRNIIQSQELERSRIARELHDSVGQNLLLIKNSFIRNNLSDNTELIDQTINEVRNISYELHPFQFDKLGLIGSIKNTIDTFQNNSKTFYSYDIQTDYAGLTKETEIVIYRMIQECLNNVEKHANAKACIIIMTESTNHIIFTIKDNGKGFTTTVEREKLKSLGLKTLYERAEVIHASLTIDSNLDQGTIITIKVPKTHLP